MTLPQIIVDSYLIAPPSEPQNFHVVQVNAESIYFSWDGPSYRGSPVSASYELSNNDYEYSDIQQESSEVSVDDLIEGVCYNFTVHVVNGGYNKSIKSLPSNSVWIATGKNNYCTCVCMHDLQTIIFQLYTAKPWFQSGNTVCAIC